MFAIRSRLASTLPADAFFDIMAAFPTGVAVVTALEEDGTPRGLSTNAFCSVSAEPPLILVCIDKTSRTLRALQRSRRFAVNFLREGGDAVCQVFASKSDSKFDGLSWRRGETGAPILEADALAHLECESEQELEAGDHVVIVGRVVAGATAEGEPLVYYRRAYGSFDPSLNGARRA